MGQRLAGLIGFFLVVVLSVGNVYAQKQVAKRTSGGIGYYEYLPSGYSTSSGNYPTIIFMHGIGERGNGTTQLNRVLKHGPPELINNGDKMTFTVNGKEYKFVVLSPQLDSNNSSWTPAYVDSFVKYVLAHYKVDKSRLYLTGLSLGGGGTWAYLYSNYNNPNKFAAAVTVSGFGSANQGSVIAARKIPVWAFHGAKDTTVPLSNEKRVVDAVNKCTSPKPDPPVKFTIYPDMGHNAWDRAYTTDHSFQNPNVYEWMLSHQLGQQGNQPPTVMAGADKTITLPTNSVTITASASDVDGKVSKYQWTKKSGPAATLSNATSSTLKVTNMVEGTYTFRLTVTDDKSATVYDDINVMVKPKPNTAPQVSAGKDISTYVQGIHYDYFELGKEYTRMPDFDRLTPKSSGLANALNLDKRKRDDRFAFRFVGYLKVAASGSYQFTMGSDDGSQLFIDKNLVVNNDGLHSYKKVSNSVSLTAGYHEIMVTYYENHGSQVFSLTWKGASMPATEVSQSLFFRDGADKDLAAQNVSGLYPGIQYYYYEGLCNKLPDFSTLKPVKMGYTDHISLEERQREDMFEMVFNGYINVPQDGQYKFYLGSDDGSKLYMDGKLLIDNGGLHSYKEDVATINLKSGYHLFKIEYFERYTHQILKLSWAGPGIGKQEVAPEYFFYDPSVQPFSNVSLAFYPNPNNGNNFYVKSDQTLDSNVQLTIVDKNGGTRTVSQGEISRVSDSEVQINLSSNLPSGLYIIQEYFPSSGKVTSQTFIVQ